MSRSPPQSPAAAVSPESLIPRSDSRNAAATCRGLTGAGRPCRRSIVTAVHRASRFIAVGGDDDAAYVDPAVFYCWQHKDQVFTALTQDTDTGRHKLERVREARARTSVDTLVDRLGVMDLSTRGSTEKLQQHREKDRRHAPSRKRNRPSPGFWQSLCCFTIPEEDLDSRYEIVRHRQRKPQPSGRQDMAQVQQVPRSARRVQQVARPGHVMPSSKLIPDTVTPQTAAMLHAEIAKPISPHDEDGYIYMFWLTNDTMDTPSEADTASLLGLHTSTRPSTMRRPTDVLQQYGTVHASGHHRHKSRDSSTGQKTVILKIGRASNVHRRMAEWTRQCGYNLSLLRFYPYISAQALASSQTTEAAMRSTSLQADAAATGIRKVPYSHRVERLIHIELRDQRVVQDACSACGSKHREWFEVAASRSDIANVDAVVKKWVAWAEVMAAGQ